MAIDTQELRRKVNSTDIVDHIDLHVNIKSILSELIGRLEDAEKEIALKERVIDALGSELNAVANERDALRAELSKQQSLTDAAQQLAEAAQRRADKLGARAEAAEKERDDVAQQLVQSEIGKREISEAHDALQVEVGKLKDIEVSRCVKINGYIVDNARLVEEVERLRAKVAEMERQEPVALVESWANGSYSRNYKLRWLRDVNEGARIYALPGAKGEEK